MNVAFPDTASLEMECAAMELVQEVSANTSEEDARVEGNRNNTEERNDERERCDEKRNSEEQRNDEKERNDEDRNGEENRSDELPLRGSVVKVNDGVALQLKDCSVLAKPELKFDREEQSNLLLHSNSETEALSKVKILNSKNHASLNNVHGIGFDLVPEYLRTNKIESGYSNIHTMEVILSSEAAMVYNDESANFQPTLSCQLVGLQPKGVQLQRIPLPGPGTVLRDDVLYFPYNNKYRRAALNVEIKPNVDALDSPIPIKLIKANTFYDKYARVHLSNKTADMWSAPHLYSNTGHGSFGVAGYFRNEYNSRNRYHSKTYGTTTSRWLMPLTPSVKYLYGSTGSLSEVSRIKTGGAWLPTWRSDRFQDPIIINQHSFTSQVTTNHTKNDAKENGLEKKTENSETRQVIVEKPYHRTNRKDFQQESNYTPKKWSTTTVETVTENKPPKPVEERWNTTTTETVIEKRPPKPVEDRWSTTTTEIVTKRIPPKPVEERWNTNVETVIEKRPPKPVEDRWNTTTVETVIEKRPPKPVEDRWRTTTTEIVTKQIPPKPVEERWNTTVETVIEKRPPKPVEDRWNTTTVETVIEKRPPKPVEDRWRTTNTEIVIEKRPPKPVEDRWSTTTTEIVTEKRPPKPVEERWNTTTTETVIENKPPKPVEDRWNRTTTEIVTENKPPKPVEDRWSTATTEIVTKQMPPKPVEERWNTTVETVIEKRPPKPVEDRWNTTTVETVIEKRPPKPVEDRWNTTTVETVIEKRPPKPVEDRWNTTTTEIVTEKRPAKPVENRWRTTTMEILKNNCDDKVKEFKHYNNATVSGEITEIAQNESSQDNHQSVNEHIVNNKKKGSCQLDSLVVCNFDSKRGFIPTNSFNSISRNDFMTDDFSHQQLSNFNCAPINITSDPSTRVPDSQRNGQGNFRVQDTWFHFEEVHPKTGNVHLIDAGSPSVKHRNKVYLDLPDSSSAFPIMQKASSFPDLCETNNLFSRPDRSKSTDYIENAGAETASTDSITYVFVSRGKGLSSTTIDKGSNRRRKLLRPNSEPCWESVNEYESDDEYFIMSPNEMSDRRTQTSEPFRYAAVNETRRHKLQIDDDTEESSDSLPRYNPTNIKKQHHSPMPPPLIAFKEYYHPINTRKGFQENDTKLLSPSGISFAKEKWHLKESVSERSSKINTGVHPNTSRDIPHCADVHVVVDRHLKSQSQVVDEELIKSVVSAYLSNTTQFQEQRNYPRDNATQNRKETKGSDMFNQQPTRKQSFSSEFNVSNSAKRNIKIIYNDTNNPHSPNDLGDTRFVFQQTPKTDRVTKERKQNSRNSTVQIDLCNNTSYDDVDSSAADSPHATASSTSTTTEGGRKTITINDKMDSQRVFVVSHKWDKDEGIVKMYVKEKPAARVQFPTLATVNQGLNVDHLRNVRSSVDNLIDDNISGHNSGKRSDEKFKFKKSGTDNILGDNELEKLRRERQEVLGLLSKDHRPSQFQVEQAEAELEYINGQTDNLLSSIDRQPLLRDAKKIKVGENAADEIELQLNVRNKNNLNRLRNLVDDETTISERRVKASSADTNCSIQRDAKQEVRQDVTGCSGIDCNRSIMSRGGNDTGLQKAEDLLHKCSSCSTAAQTPKWTTASRRTTAAGQCTYCNAADCSVRSCSQATRLNLSGTTQHSAAICDWKRLQSSTGRSNNSRRLSVPQCPLCTFPRHVSQSISDLSGSETTQVFRHHLLSHRSQPDISNILDNDTMTHCSSKGGCPILQGRSRQSPQGRKTPQRGNASSRRRRTSFADRSLSSSYSTLFNPTRLAAFNWEPRYDSLSHASSNDSAIFSEPVYKPGFATDKVRVPLQAAF